MMTEIPEANKGTLCCCAMANTTEFGRFQSKLKLT